MTWCNKIKIFGYIDLCTTTSQLLLTSVTTSVSLYFHFKDAKREDNGNAMSVFTPAFNLLTAVFVVYTHVGLILAVRKLMKPGYYDLCDWELNEIRDNWGCWNGASCVGLLFWYPLFGVTMFQEYNWPLAYIGVSFVVIAGTRVVLTSIFYRMLDDEEGDQIPPLELEMMEPAIAMHGLRRPAWI